MAKDLPNLIVKGRTLNGFPAFVVQQVAKAMKTKDATAIEYIAQRWALTDPEAEKYDATMAVFRALPHEAGEGARIHRISDKKREKKQQEPAGEEKKDAMDENGGVQ
jgi:hypothetical protein